MIYVLATIELNTGTRSQFLELMLANVPLVEAEDGCLEYQPVIDTETGLPAQGDLRPDTVVVVEKWRDLDALRAHLQAPHMLAYREKVKDLVQGVNLQVLSPAG